MPCRPLLKTVSDHGKFRIAATNKTLNYAWGLIHLEKSEIQVGECASSLENEVLEVSRLVLKELIKS